jgi:hypothetical protein
VTCPDRCGTTCYSAVPNRISPANVKNAPAVSVKTRLVKCAVSAEPYNHPLIGASSAILSFALSAFAFVRAGFDHINDAPHLTDLTKSVVEIVVTAQKSKVRQISDYGTSSHALEEVYSGFALRAENVGSSDGYLGIGKPCGGPTICARYLHVIT